MLDPELVDFFNDFKKEIKEELSSMNGKIDSMENEIGSMKSDIGSMKSEMGSMNERITSLERICTIIEKEHGEKLDLLLDYASANIEKHEIYDKKFDEIDRKIFIHDAKLAIIEGSDLYKKNIKGKGKSNLRNAL